MRNFTKYPMTWKPIPERCIVGNDDYLGYSCFHFEFLTRNCRYVIERLNGWNCHKPFQYCVSKDTPYALTSEQLKEKFI